MKARLKLFSLTFATLIAFSAIAAPPVALDNWPTVNVATGVIGITIDGGGSAIGTGVKGYIRVPYSAVITRSTIIADRSGSIVINVWKCTYAQFDAGATHPVAGDKITASAPPTVSAATKAEDTTLTGWTTTLNEGDILAFNVDSASTIQRATLSLKLQKQ